MLTLTVLETAFVGVLVVGVALVNVPAALVLAGLLGILACERTAARRALVKAEAEAEKPKGARG